MMEQKRTRRVFNRAFKVEAVELFILRQLSKPMPAGFLNSKNCKPCLPSVTKWGYVSSLPTWFIPTGSFRDRLGCSEVKMFELGIIQNWHRPEAGLFGCFGWDARSTSLCQVQAWGGILTSRDSWPLPPGYPAISA